MTGITIHYLLTYSYRDQVVEIEQFKDSKKAMTAYAAKEAEYSNRSDEFEVVLVGADSIDTIMKTHGHYFAKSLDKRPSQFSDLLFS
ncbi:MAG: hypothetical protein PGN07_06340 [Aeromicrobium erythreum]